MRRTTAIAARTVFRMKKLRCDLSYTNETRGGAREAARHVATNGATARLETCATSGPLKMPGGREEVPELTWVARSIIL